MKLTLYCKKLVLHQQSIKTARKNGHSFIYMDKKYVNWKTEIQEQIPNMDTLFYKATKLSVIIIFPIPKSWTKKKKEELAGTVRLPTPDIDNALKGLIDSFINTIIVDDNIIVWYENMLKLWHKDVNEEQIIIIININELTDKELQEIKEKDWLKDG